MNYTPNYNLSKPEKTEYFNVDTWNSNMDIIDSELDGLENNKVNKVTGKALSTNDYTDAEKNKLSTIEDNANNYVLPQASVSTVGGVKIDNNTITIDENGTISAITSSIESISNINDVDISGVQNGNALIYNSYIQKWVPGNSIGIIDYDDISNRPQINNVTLSGNKTASDLGLATSSAVNSKITEPASEGTNGQVLVTDGHGGRTWATVGGGGGGDMYKATYDQNNNGIVDSAETIDGLTASVSELNYMSGVTSAVQTQINSLSNAKADKSTTYTKTEVDGLIPTSLSDLSDDSTHRLVTDSEKSGWDAKADTSDIPTALSELTADSSHRLVTDAEKSGWDAKVDSSSLDGWTGESTLASGNTVTFTGLNDAYGYKLFAVDNPKPIAFTDCAMTGSGTSMQLVYTVSGSNLQVGVSKFKLRIIK